MQNDFNVNAFENVSAKKSRKKYLVPIGITILILFSLLAIGNGFDDSSPTGRFVDGNDYITNNHDDEDITQFRNIEINSEMNVEDYEVIIPTLDLEITAEKVKIAGSDMEISIHLDSIVELKEFDGKISWYEGKISLEGELSEYLNEFIEINWKNPDQLKMIIEEGEIKIDNLDIPSWTIMASGEVDIGTKINLDLNRDRVYMENYKGSFYTQAKEGKNIVMLDGKTEGFSIRTEEFDARWY